MMSMGQVRQGDILLIPVDRTPPEGMTSQSEAVLALGETTGHAHRVSGAVIDWRDGDNRFVHVLEGGYLSHEDHDPEPAAVLTLGQTYQVVQQREWQINGLWREIRD